MTDKVFVPLVQRRDDPFFQDMAILGISKPLVNAPLEASPDIKIIQKAPLYKVMDTPVPAEKGSVDLPKETSNLPFLQQSIYNQVQAEYALSDKGPVQSLK